MVGVISGKHVSLGVIPKLIEDPFDILLRSSFSAGEEPLDCPEIVDFSDLGVEGLNFYS